MNDIVITKALRTPIGSFGGAFKETGAVELGTLTIRGVLEQTGLEPSKVDEVIMGNVLGAGLGQNVARQMAMAAGIPREVPSMTINKVCGSGLRAVTLAVQILRAGDASCIVAGGAENMSRAPYLLPDARWGQRIGDAAVVDYMVHDGLYDIFNEYHMGITAENVAEKWNISREEQDAFAFQSQEKALRAIDDGKFRNEIIPVSIPQRKGYPIIVSDDEYPRKTSPENLPPSSRHLKWTAALRPGIPRESMMARQLWY